MRRRAVFIDTWGWLALGDSQEPQHQEITRFYEQLEDSRVPIYTSDYVLAELVTLLYRRVHFSRATSFIEGILVSSEERDIEIELVTPGHFSSAWKLRKQFQDKTDISFTDLASMVIMRELGIQQVLTGDAHFTHAGMGFIRVPESATRI